MSSAGRGARAQKARRNTAGAPHEYDDNDKTIPFLRRLTDMLQENEESISFYRGGKVTIFLVSLFAFSLVLILDDHQMADLPDWPDLIEVSMK